MSRYYNMFVTITGADPDRFGEIKAAASAEWGFEDWDEFTRGPSRATPSAADPPRRHGRI